MRDVLGAYDSATQALRKYTVGLPSTIARSLIGNPAEYGRAPKRLQGNHQWIVHPSKGVIFDLRPQGQIREHVRFMEEIGLPSSGEAFDRIERGWLDVDTRKGEAVVKSWQGEFAHPDVEKQVTAAYPESKDYEWRDRSYGLKPEYSFAGKFNPRGTGDVHSALAEIAEKYPVNPDNQKERVLLAQGVPAVYFEVAANGDRLRLRGIRSARGAERTGIASLLLDRLVKLADRHGVTMELTASPYGPQSLDKEQLIRWYSKHGFRMEPGYDEALGYMIHPNPDDPSTPESILRSLQLAEEATRTHQLRRAAILDRLPDGQQFKIGRTLYTKMTLSGDIFWVSGKRGLTSREMAIELGTRLKENPMPKISTKDPATMTAGEINKELDRIDALDRALTDAFITAGRGHERPSDYWPPRPGDTLAAQSLELYNRASKLRYEIQREYGPGAPSRFPHGWRRSLMRRNPDPTPGELETSYEEHLELVSSPEFIEASPEEQAAMMTGLDMGEHGDREHGHDCGCDHEGAHPHWQEIAEQVVGNPRRNPNVTVAQAKDLFYRMGQQAGRGARIKPHYPGSDPKGVEARADITAQNFIETYRLAEARTNEIADQYIRGFYDAYKSKARRNRRRNPAAAADRMFESFHGYPPDKTIEVEEEFHEHEHLATLGRLVELVVKTVTGYKAEIGFEPKMPWLATNEDGTQLYVVGGNQSLDLKALHFTEAYIKDNMVIGQLFGLVYRTRKDWHDGERDEEDTDYDHKVGEESGELPDLLYDPISKKLSMAGGRYRIEMPSGQTSPGIED